MTNVSGSEYETYIEPVKDSLDRRSRFSLPQPGAPFKLTPVRLAVLEALAKHRRLPTGYLHHFMRPHAGDYQYAQDTLTKLYNGFCDKPEHKKGEKHTCSLHHYINRHWIAYDNATPCIYGLSPEGEQVVEPQPHISSSASPVHDLFASCLTASFDLLTEFHPRSKVLERAPDAAKIAVEPFSFETPHGTIVPDDYFMLSIPEGFRAFALEADRATETVRSKNVPSKIQKKIHGYVHIMQHGMHRTQLNSPHLSVLFATTSAARIATIIALIRETVPVKFQHRFLFKHFPSFGLPYRVPREPLDVLSPWLTAIGEDTPTKKAPA